MESSDINLFTSQGLQFSNLEDQLASSIFKTKIDDESRERLTAVFKELNLNKNGYLSILDLRSAIKKYLNFDATKETILHIISEIDNDDHGEISLESFVNAISLYDGSSNRTEGGLSRL